MIGGERHFHFVADPRVVAGTLRNLELDPQGTELADAETLVVFHHVLALANVTADDHAIERGGNFHF